MEPKNHPKQRKNDDKKQIQKNIEAYLQKASRKLKKGGQTGTFGETFGGQKAPLNPKS